MKPQVIVCKNYEEMSEKAADILAALLKEKPACVLGLPTGSTPVGMYKALARKNAAGEIDFSRVVTYNLDEYYPISPENDQSYRYFMNFNLFDHININKENTHVPDGSAADPEAACAAYDEAYAATGYADIQVLGIGQNGHIAFNEPGDVLVAGTHITSLTENTIAANARFFASADLVPKQAMTMGIGPIMQAKKILMLINGKNKHDALMGLIGNDEITTKNPATVLKLHPDVLVLCDEDAYNG